MRYDDRIIDQIQTANDIAEVIGQVLPLKRAGRNLKANCPFHGEKTPSFMVNPEKQIYHCFGCGVGGSVFSFLMRYENLSFPEAVRHLAERANIPLPVESRGEQGAGDTEKIYEVYRLAVEYYRSQFLESAQAKPARDYFFGRGYDAAFAEEFKIGWAPEGWRGLLEVLTRKGFPEPLLLKTGLVLKSP
ncbi:MAG TPA: CHC2 zinc finger domain-containing protein, partial [bacterium]|nr:CHC2 zinc finger domain-containing protein [bacterium]